MADTFHTDIDRDREAFPKPSRRAPAPIWAAA